MDSRFIALVNTAKHLFISKGYSNVGIREITALAGCSPVQAYRLGLSKIDLLAEVSIAITNDQIQSIPRLNKILDSEDIFSYVIRYLTKLYESDIQNIKIRRETAAYGWMWSIKYEDRIISQIFALLDPIIEAFKNNSYDQIEARCLGIWSLYYVGFRSAVVYNQTPDECIKSISSSLKLLCIK